MSSKIIIPHNRKSKTGGYVYLAICVSDEGNIYEIGHWRFRKNKSKKRFPRRRKKPYPSQIIENLLCFDVYQGKVFVGLEFKKYKYRDDFKDDFYQIPEEDIMKFRKKMRELIDEFNQPYREAVLREKAFEKKVEIFFTFLCIIGFFWLFPLFNWMVRHPFEPFPSTSSLLSNDIESFQEAGESK